MVDLFFVLSGFVMMHAHGETFVQGATRGTVVPYLGRRIRRIYPMHVVMLGLFVALELAKLGIAGLAPHAFEPPYAPEGIAWNLLLLQGYGFAGGLGWNVPAWSLGPEMAAYLLFPVLVPRIARARRTALLGLYLATVAGLASIARDSRDLDLSGGLGLVRCLLDFTGGAVLWRVWRRWPSPLLGRDATSVAALGTALLLMHLNAAGAVVVPVFGLTILALAANRACVRAALSAAPLQWLGRLSFAIYMSHYLLIEVANAAAVALTGQPVAGLRFTPAAAVLLTGALIAATLLLAWTLDRLVDHRRARARDGATFPRMHHEATTERPFRSKEAWP
jgi:peptidoglycan/LPS O-acetylase OafA/YrhL